MKFPTWPLWGDIQYQDLLEHLSITFHGGDDEANILAEFYSHSHKSKETEEAFADKLQLLAHKVISKKPDFHHNFDTTLKQWYTNHLYDCNNASIAKTLLLQMPKVTFTQFYNKLARVLGTHQHSKGSNKAVSVSVVGTSSEGKRHYQCISRNVRPRWVLSLLRLETYATN